LRRLYLILSLLTLLIAALACRTLASPDLTFSPETLPEAVVGQPYQVEILVSDNNTPVGDMYIQDGALPPGLALEFIEHEDHAELTGIPEAAGVYTFTVGAWCYGTNVSGDRGEIAYELAVR
jgi:hypothetical protein